VNGFGAAAPLGGAASPSSGGTFPGLVAPMMICSAVLGLDKCGKLM